MQRKKTFRKKDFSTGDGMSTAVWGPAMWHVLHTISFNYPVNPSFEEKRHYMDFIYNLRFVLPCKHCRENLVKNLKTLPLTITTMKNRDSFSRYVYKLHELVNKMLKKKSKWTYAAVRERYEHFRSRCTTAKVKHAGCTEPIYGVKSRCILNIVPAAKNKSKDSIQVAQCCYKTRRHNKTTTTRKKKNTNKQKVQVKVTN